MKKASMYLGTLLMGLFLMTSCNNQNSGSESAVDNTAQTEEESSQLFDENGEEILEERFRLYDWSQIDMSKAKNLNNTTLSKNIHQLLHLNKDENTDILSNPYFVQLVKNMVTNKQHLEMIASSETYTCSSSEMRIGYTTEIECNSVSHWPMKYTVEFIVYHDVEYDVTISIYDGIELLKTYTWTNAK